MYDYGFRIYDPRIARFLSVDPLSDNFPELTPYQYASNNPIMFIDIDGLEGGTPKIEYGTNAVVNVVSAHSIKVIQELGQKVGMKKLLITSTYRTPEKQMNAMYTNLKKTGGVEKNYKLYSSKGDKVIDAFVEASNQPGATPEKIKAAMLKKAIEVGFVSGHSSQDYSKYNVIDINRGDWSEEDYQAMKKAALEDPRIAVVKGREEGDEALHLEIPQTNIISTPAPVGSSNSNDNLNGARKNYQKNFFEKVWDTIINGPENGYKDNVPVNSSTTKNEG
jgi:uncharacterized protein RhaS with RHS repeats